MSLSVGIVGLPNVGKSTLFNALLKRAISPVANYPFTTIKPYTGVVEVPDSRIEELADVIKPEKVTYATVTFIDLAGLVKNAHQSEGLGNEFLGQIRNVDVLIHVIREFESQTAPHLMGSVDAARDRQIIREELKMAEIDKPMLEWVNRDLAEFERVDELIRKAYELLELVSFYTIKGGKEVRAWSLNRGGTAVEAAGKVHTDFAQRFIKAEVINVGELIACG